MIEAKTPTLFELTDDFKRLIDMGYPEITDKDSEEEKAEKSGEIELFEDTLNMIMECIGDKADSYCYAMAMMRGRSDILKKEINRLSTMKDAIDNAENRMKDRLKQTLEAMEESGIEKPQIKTDLRTIKLAGNGGVQPLKVIEEKVPDSYKQVILKTDNEKIRKALESGEKLDFAELLPRGRHLTGIK